VFVKILYCLDTKCRKIKEEGSDEWVKSETPLEVLAGMKGVKLEPEYCDDCGAVLDGIAKENRLRNQIEKGNYD
jgi:hypothetical protein